MDFAVSWVQSLGKGRVFYCSLGHRHDVFWNPKVLAHYLDGIQFALGDLPADAEPRGTRGAKEEVRTMSPGWMNSLLKSRVTISAGAGSPSPGRLT